MAASRRWLAVALLLVALLASLEFMPRNVIFRAAIPVDAAFPANEGPGGTSILWGELEERGYSTAIVYGTSGIYSKARDATDIVYLLVAPATPAPEAPEEPLEAVKRLLAMGKRVHVILLDEAPARRTWEFIEEASTAICGAPPPFQVVGPLNNSIAVIEATVGGERIVAPTGYTGILSGNLPLAYSTKPLIPMSINNYQFFAAAWPSEPWGQWGLVGARCASPRGSVTVLADSTVAVNLATGTNREALRLSLALVESIAPYKAKTLIVVDESFYAGAPGSSEVNLILRLHPSVFILALSQVYSIAEDRVVAAFAGYNILWLLALAAGLVLLSASWLATPASASWPKGRRGGRGLRIRAPRGLLGPWSAASRACMRARRLASMIPSSGPRDPAWEHVEWYLSQIHSTCRIVEKTPLPLRFVPVWGWAARRALEAAARAALISGVVPPEEVERIGEGQEASG